MNRYLVPLVAVMLLIGFLVFGLRQGDPHALPSPFIGKPAPTFELPTLADPAVTVGSADLAGKFSLVNVWATWCAGCRAEHGFLMKLAAEKTVPIYGINWRDSRPEALRWIEQLGDPYVASAFDGTGRVGIDWGVYGAPETFLVGPDGIVLHKHLGPLDQAAWQEEFVPKIRAAGGNL